MSETGHFDPGAPLPLLPGHSSGGRLERVLRLGRFAVTAELNPPDSADPRDVYERALVLSEVCDAINATDASGANCHMSSVGICSLLTRAGYAVIMQISCRDRNRIAIQGDVFLGAAANPFAPPYEHRATHIAKKIAAGAQFIQTQYCFDVPLLRKFMDKVREQGLHKKAFFLIGVGPLPSAKTARWMKNNVPGVHIPEAILERMEKAKDQRAEGKQLAIDLIQEIKEIDGVAGVHVMAYRQEEFVSEIIQASGVMRNRQQRRAGETAAG